ncbi:MAG: cytochrome c [bacterium]|nr:cytochrome c [bacterium]
MKIIRITAVIILILSSCGGGQSSIDRIKEQTMSKPSDPYANWESNQGIGPIQAFTLPQDIDQALVGKGKEVYESKCTACHKIDKKFIGPSPAGILTRRTPAWIMNMILNPDGMVQEDPMAKQLLMDFNGSPMANQNLTEDDARAVLEYFRTL